MIEQLIADVQQQMLPHLNNEQLQKLRDALVFCLHGMEVKPSIAEPMKKQPDMVHAFIAAKRIEGCSERTLAYYYKTITAMLDTVSKPAQRITTDDIRLYLTSYQTKRKCSKVTIDNIRRILSSFFSWLEDEDYIGKKADIYLYARDTEGEEYYQKVGRASKLVEQLRKN